MSTFDVKRLVDLGRVTAAVPHPDGTWAAVAVQRHDAEKAKYVSDLWRVPMDGGSPTRLTLGSHSDSAPAFRRDGSLAFLAARPRPDAKDGDEPVAQVWLLPALGGEPRPLTDEPLGVQGFAFAKEADRLVVIAPVLPGVAHDQQREAARDLAKKGPSAIRYDRMPVRFWDHWLPVAAPHLVAYDADGGGRRDLTPNADREHRGAEWDLSADGSVVAVTRSTPARDRLVDTAILLISTADGSVQRVLGEGPLTNYGGPKLSPDGKTLVCTRHVRGTGKQGGEQLHLFDLATGEGRPLAAGWDVWPHPCDWTDDGRIVCVADFQGAKPVFTVDSRTGEVVRITGEASGGSHEGVTVCGGVAVGVRSRLTHPPEPFAVRLAEGSAPRLLATLSGFTEAEADAIVSVEQLVVPGDGGVPVQSWVVTPRAGTGARPGLMWIHGGPMGAWGDGWHWRWNPIVGASQGYTLVLPNPRGSTGFGQDFVEGIWGNVWGAACYRDLLAVADAFCARPDVDGARAAAMGGSFGGYMTNWIGGNTDRFRALVTHASVYSMSAFHGVTDSPAYWAYAMGGAPYGREDFDVYSPHARVGRWKSPTLVIHGEKDYRVPVSEGLALFEGLQHHGVDSELLIFPDENHWILKPRNVVAWYEAVFAFLGKHLRP